MLKVSGFISRMLHYEDLSNPQIMHAAPLIIRVDALNYGRFHELIPEQFRGCCQQAWINTMKAMTMKIAGAAVGYWQTDEIVVVITEMPNGEAWMNRETQRTASVAASLATSLFNKTLRELADEQYTYMEHTEETANALNKLHTLHDVLFHCVAYAVPAHEAPNVLMWRQQRAQGRIIQREAAKLYTQDEMQGKNLVALQQMLWEAGIDWRKGTTPEECNGCFCYYVKGDDDRYTLEVDRRVPDFVDDKKYITSKLYDKRSHGDSSITLQPDEMSLVLGEE